jgi:hypothetical protein
MAYNSLTQLRTNIEAIRIALAYKPGDRLEETQVNNLRDYAGFGGLKAILFPEGPVSEWEKLNASQNDLKLYPSVMELHQLLRKELSETDYKSAVDSLRESVLTAYYTPEVVPQVLYQALKEFTILPSRLYEPSSGAGIFITEAIKSFPELQQVTAVEKDLLTGKVLTALAGTLPVPAAVQIKGLEQTAEKENGQYDLIVSNIPFGNFQVFDPVYPEKSISGKIHNYFFAKGMDKLADGGIMAFITTDAFLNAPSNRAAREHVFNRADFISLSVMPDNLMKDTGNTEAPSHLLVLQKRNGKTSLSKDEQLLLETDWRETSSGAIRSIAIFLARGQHCYCRHHSARQNPIRAGHDGVLAKGRYQ